MRERHQPQHSRDCARSKCPYERLFHLAEREGWKVKLETDTEPAPGGTVRSWLSRLVVTDGGSEKVYADLEEDDGLDGAAAELLNELEMV